MSLWEIHNVNKLDKWQCPPPHTHTHFQCHLPLSLPRELTVRGIRLHCSSYPLISNIRKTCRRENRHLNFEIKGTTVVSPHIRCKPTHTHVWMHMHIHTHTLGTRRFWQAISTVENSSVSSWLPDENKNLPMKRCSKMYSQRSIVWNQIYIFICKSCVLIKVGAGLNMETSRQGTGL